MVESAWIDINGDDKEAVIVGGGALDLTNSTDLWKGLSRASESAESVVVDLRQAVFIDTAVLEHLAKAGRTMIGRNKRLKVLTALDQQPLYVLKTVGFSSLMDIVAEKVDFQDDNYGPG